MYPLIHSKKPQQFFLMSVVSPAPWGTLQHFFSSFQNHVTNAVTFNPDAVVDYGTLISLCRFDAAGLTPVSNRPERHDNKKVLCWGGDTRQPRCDRA